MTRRSNHINDLPFRGKSIGYMIRVKLTLWWFLHGGHIQTPAKAVSKHNRETAKQISTTLAISLKECSYFKNSADNNLITKLCLSAIDCQRFSKQLSIYCQVKKREVHKNMIGCWRLLHCNWMICWSCVCGWPPVCFSSSLIAGSSTVVYYLIRRQ